VPAEKKEPAGVLFDTRAKRRSKSRLTRLSGTINLTSRPSREVERFLPRDSLPWWKRLVCPLLSRPILLIGFLTVILAKNTVTDMYYRKYYKKEEAETSTLIPKLRKCISS
jgi:hypothetical protein